MPAYKVPCPRCGQFIMRDVAVCPFCQSRDPFAPIRCVACNTIIEDSRWTACPQCGTAVPGRSQPPAAPAQPAPAQGQPAPAAPRLCTGCGAALVAGARFCNVCGTLAG